MCYLVEHSYMWSDEWNQFRAYFFKVELDFTLPPVAPVGTLYLSFNTCWVPASSWEQRRLSGSFHTGIWHVFISEQAALKFKHGFWDSSIYKLGKGTWMLRTFKSLFLSLSFLWPPFLLSEQIFSVPPPKVLLHPLFPLSCIYHQPCSVLYL